MDIVIKSEPSQDTASVNNPETHAHGGATTDQSWKTAAADCINHAKEIIKEYADKDSKEVIDSLDMALKALDLPDNAENQAPDYADEMIQNKQDSNVHNKMFGGDQSNG